ncbi:molecular chaperone TorD family protein [Desulfobacula sp.]|uniref:TorD/DmsD family molecular chaperone n=1 Tax=Desulfobacula sp. TaxID=2593537 RepID=UPI002608E5C7|nr:molecular chaperone TorD family protein [Desulfobacula sp.]
MIFSDQYVQSSPEIREMMYTRVAQALNYPDQDLVAGLLDYSFIQNLLAIVEEIERPGTKEAVQDLQQEYGNTTKSPEDLLLALEKDYTWMCFASKPRQVYLFESVYREGKLLQESTFEIARLYYEAGLQMDEGFDMPPDHIATEFEFLAYLCFREIEGINEDDEEKKMYAQTLQHQVLEEHLGPFASRFARALEHNAGTSFYKAMGRFIQAIV